MSEKRESWGSRFGFVMATAGFSIGLGSVWRFPYLVSTNGGGAFLFVYILICALICIPLFLAEMSLGRKTKLGPILGMRQLTSKGSPWVLIGWLGAAASFIIMSYYFMVLGWMLAYLVKAITGTFAGVKDPALVKEIFTKFSSNPLEVLAYTGVIILITGYIITQGIQKGIEKACSWMLPLLFVLVLALVVRALTLPGSSAGLAWYLTPDLSKVTGATVLSAMGQAFFAVGVGVACAFLYGSYLKDDSNLPADASLIVSLVTLIAFLCGLIIFPSLSAFGMSNASGPALVFETMPVLFAHIPFGQFFSIMFYFLVVLAGLTSAMGYVQAVAGTIGEVVPMDRKKFTWLVSGLLFLANIPSALSFSDWKELYVMGSMNFFDFFDFLSGNVMMPVVALMISLYTVFVWKFDNFMNETNVGSIGGVTAIRPAWKPLVVVLIPVAVAVIMITGLI